MTKTLQEMTGEELLRAFVLKSSYARAYGADEDIQTTREIHAELLRLVNLAKATGRQWIPCAERMPGQRPTYSTSARVEIYFPSHSEEYRFRFGRYDFKDDLFNCDGGSSFDAKDASHWRPLPPAPAKPAEGPVAQKTLDIQK